MVQSQRKLLCKSVSLSLSLSLSLSVSLSLCVCVCVREREREREISQKEMPIVTTNLQKTMLLSVPELSG